MTKEVSLLKDGDEPKPRVVRQCYEKTNCGREPYQGDYCNGIFGEFLISTLQMGIHKSIWWIMRKRRTEKTEL